jgi:acyl-CoA reductase-like NAD-dependent aldehyde dehydrogenase
MEDASAMMHKTREQARELAAAPVKERMEALEQLNARIRDWREWIVEKVMEDTGKTRTDALVSDVLGTLDYIHWVIKSGPKILADEKASTPLALMGKKSRIWHEPLGVVLVITPWNYPFHIAMTTVAGALAAGNGVLLKPSEHTPLHGVFEELVRGIPLLERNLHVHQGDGEVAQSLIEAGPDKIFFTGSAPTGRKILAQAAPLLIPVDLELGGKDAMIVFDDVHLKRTVAGALWGALTNAGQSCTSVERLYVQRGLYDEFVRQLENEVDELVINTDDQGDADIGAITAGFQCDIIREHLEDARQKGARIHGGEGVEGNDHIIQPAVISGITDEMRLMHEETFGPLIPVIPFDTEEEAIRLADHPEFGLSASVWSKDLDRAERVARRIRAGAVPINNVMVTEGNPDLPFGGTGESGFGRVKGAEGLRGFTRSKAVMIDKQSDTIEANWYPYTRQKYELFGRLIEGLFSGRLIKFALAGLKLESISQKRRSEHR